MRTVGLSKSTLAGFFSLAVARSSSGPQGNGADAGSGGTTAGTGGAAAGSGGSGTGGALGTGGSVGTGGGDFTKIDLAWLNWQLKGDETATGKGLLVGAGCPYCQDSAWEVKSKNIP